MTVLFIDTRDRLLSVWTASVTQTATGLVLRLAAQLGSLAELVANRGRRMEFPLVIGTGGYQAQSSAGFVSVRCGSWGVARPDIVGGTGFGYEKYLETEGRTRRVGDGLRRFREPLPAVFLPAGCTVETVLTHGNSNHDTANAAVAGLELLGAGLGVVVIAEGQSDRTRGFAIRGFAADRTGQGWREEMPLEHRLELFTLATAAVDEALRAFVDQRVASKVADRRVCWRVAEHLAAMFAAANALDELPEFAGAVEAVVEAGEEMPIWPVNEKPVQASLADAQVDVLTRLAMSVNETIALLGQQYDRMPAGGGSHPRADGSDNR